MVTANNELYQFANPEKSVFDGNYPLFLRDVRGEQVRLVEVRNLKLGQSQNEVHFEFTQPNFTGFRATEFRYRVSGLSDDWTSWDTENNLVTLTFLPPGEYQLEVQSRDVLGNESYTLNCPLGWYCKNAPDAARYVSLPNVTPTVSSNKGF